MACNKLYNSMFTPWTSCGTACIIVILFNFLLMYHVGKKLWINVFLKTT